MLREKSQRRLCRWLFVVGCLLPTLLVSGWAFARYHPLYKSLVLAEVSERLGLRVVSQHFSTPRPGEYRVRGVELYDPLTDKLVARCDRLQARQEGEAWQVIAGHLELALPGDSQAASPQLPTLPNHPMTPLTGRIDQLTIGLEQPVATWERLTLDLASDVRTEESAEYALTHTLQLRSHHPSGDADAELDLEGRPAESAATFRFDTGSQPVSGELIASLSEFKQLARNAAFQGTIEGELDSQRSVGEATGLLTITACDESATGGRASWESASFQIDTCKWHGPMIHRIDVAIDMKQGTLDSSIVYGMNNRLGCRHGRALSDLWGEAPPAMTPFDQLACQLQFDVRGLTLIGNCQRVDGRPDNVLAHALLMHEDAPLLFQPQEKQQPFYLALQALAPNAPVQLPATQTVQRLVRLLPLPTDATLQR